jgi:hypothetical protein
LTLAWIAFLAVGTFFALLTPLGEGIDEPAHFAYVQHVAERYQAPLGHSKHFSEEVSRFLRIQPVSWSLHTLDPTLLSHDEYWQEGPDVRASRDAMLHAMRFSGDYVESTNAADVQYESHQPPLYYVLAAPVFLTGSRWLPFAGVFVLTRLWSVLLASFVIPGAFLLAGIVFEKDALATASVLGLIVAFPGLYPGVVRVSNDALAASLAAWLFFCLVGFLYTGGRPYLYGLCALVIAGLWTKAFFIPLLAAAILCLLLYGHARSAVLLLLISMAGWPWYFLNWIQSGSLTGLPETVQANTTLASSLAVLRKLDWGNVGAVLRSSHIWIGNGSLLGVRTWIYRVIGWIFLVMLLGLLRPTAMKARLRIWPLALCYVVFAASLIYFATQVFQRTGESVIQGWYLTMFIPVEAVLIAAGARSWFPTRWTLAVRLFGFMLLALLIYSALFVALPYYAGFIAHGPSGHVATYHPHLRDLSVITQRLLRFESAVPAFLPWLLLCVGAAMIGILNKTRHFERSL